ncbi:MAG: dockerin type I repeat-containing protein [Oscillospiraceae bacterium]|nr:dockerin type I repeat-containing protein [Oscillospiraceae bacterium]
MKKIFLSLFITGYIFSSAYGASMVNAVEPDSSSTTVSTPVLIEKEWGVGVARAPDKCIYKIGEVLDLTGLRINGHTKEIYDTIPDGIVSEIINEDYYYLVKQNVPLTIDDSEFDNTKAGTYTVYVVFGKDGNFARDGFTVDVVNEEGESEPTSLTFQVKSLYEYNGLKDALKMSDEDLEKFFSSMSGSSSTNRETAEKFAEQVDKLSVPDLVRGDITWICYSKGISADSKEPYETVYVTVKNENTEWIRYEYLLNTDLNDLKYDSSVETTVFETPLASGDGSIKVFAKSAEAHPSGTGDIVTLYTGINDVTVRMIYYMSDAAEFDIENVISSSLVKVDGLENKETAAITGDINNDLNIDVTDLSELSLALIGDKKLSEAQQKAADVDKDGKVTLSDLARMRQHLSKVITSFD